MKQNNLEKEIFNIFEELKNKAPPQQKNLNKQKKTSYLPSVFKNEITMPDLNWNELAQSIADCEAILVLGPDAIPDAFFLSELPNFAATISKR